MEENLPFAIKISMKGCRHPMARNPTPPSDFQGKETIAENARWSSFVDTESAAHGGIKLDYYYTKTAVKELRFSGRISRPGSKDQNKSLPCVSAEPSETKNFLIHGRITTSCRTPRGHTSMSSSYAKRSVFAVSTRRVIIIILCI